MVRWFVKTQTMGEFKCCDGLWRHKPWESAMVCDDTNYGWRWRKNRLLTWPRWKGIAPRSYREQKQGTGSSYSEGYGKTAGKGAEERESDDSPKTGNTNREQEQGTVSSYCSLALYLWSHQESNLDQKFRKLPFYPLNYGTYLKTEQR